MPSLIRVLAVSPGDLNTNSPDATLITEIRQSDCHVDGCNDLEKMSLRMVYMKIISGKMGTYAIKRLNNKMCQSNEILLV